LSRLVGLVLWLVSGLFSGMFYMVQEFGTAVYRIAILSTYLMFETSAQFQFLQLHKENFRKSTILCFSESNERFADDRRVLLATWRLHL